MGVDVGAAVGVGVVVAIGVGVGVDTPPPPQALATNRTKASKTMGTNLLHLIMYLRT